MGDAPVRVRVVGALTFRPLALDMDVRAPHPCSHSKVRVTLTEASPIEDIILLSLKKRGKFYMLFLFILRRPKMRCCDGEFGGH